jgi:hypothetical protein
MARERVIRCDHPGLLETLKSQERREAAQHRADWRDAGDQGDNR